MENREEPLSECMGSNGTIFVLGLLPLSILVGLFLHFQFLWRFKDAKEVFLVVVLGVCLSYVLSLQKYRVFEDKIIVNNLFKTRAVEYGDISRWEYRGMSTVYYSGGSFAFETGQKKLAYLLSVLIYRDYQAEGSERSFDDIYAVVNSGDWQSALTDSRRHQVEEYKEEERRRREEMERERQERDRLEAERRDREREEERRLECERAANESNGDGGSF
ncbi:MAG: hypothetical protein Q4P78_02370 [Rothia sp. (in: high G+C Gram-positive bacteria)]|uniref:hypothetical protein n=1 Tax=Rothia sp. (in: high G+C Gram-positive bacteria) TaxID=1885016 RepID=UPI0026E04C4C|nr:hypothetical protein [Rothia sp. (in: high G+C Gram-positive bacteria)]MDO5750032.1 hypothetical protein [Rothia sp. (in: high G+C Gram-positive bacteria)]